MTLLYYLFLFVFRKYQHLTFARFGTSFFRFPFVKHLTLPTLGLFPFSQAKSHPLSWQLNFTFPENFKLFFFRISPQLVIVELVGKKSTPIFAVSDEAITPQETFERIKIKFQNFYLYWKLKISLWVNIVFACQRKSGFDEQKQLLTFIFHAIRWYNWIEMRNFTAES